MLAYVHTSGSFNLMWFHFRAKVLRHSWGSGESLVSFKCDHTLSPTFSKSFQFPARTTEVTLQKTHNDGQRAVAPALSFWPSSSSLSLCWCGLFLGLWRSVLFLCWLDNICFCQQANFLTLSVCFFTFLPRVPFPTLSLSRYLAS